MGDTIGERLPGLPTPWHRVTLRQLLNHTSGLPNFTEDPGYLNALDANLKDPPPPRKLLSYVKDEPLNFEPGTRYLNFNSDNVTVGLMAQAATGSPYEAQLRRQVYGPLGLEKTSLPRGADLKAPFIHGYQNDPSQRPPADISEILAPGWLWASGGMVSTPHELNDFARGYVGGKLFDQNTRARAPAHRPRRWTLRPTRTRDELGRAGDLPLPDLVRDGVGPHGQPPRLHPVSGSEPGREALGDGVRKRAAKPHTGRSRSFRTIAHHGTARCMRRAGRLKA